MNKRTNDNKSNKKRKKDQGTSIVDPTTKRRVSTAFLELQRIKDEEAKKAKQKEVDENPFIEIAKEVKDLRKYKGPSVSKNVEKWDEDAEEMADKGIKLIDRKKEGPDYYDDFQIEHRARTELDDYIDNFVDEYEGQNLFAKIKENPYIDDDDDDEDYVVEEQENIDLDSALEEFANQELEDEGEEDYEDYEEDDEYGNDEDYEVEQQKNIDLDSALEEFVNQEQEDDDYYDNETYEDKKEENLDYDNNDYDDYGYGEEDSRIEQHEEAVEKTKRTKKRTKTDIKKSSKKNAKAPKTQVINPLLNINLNNLINEEVIEPENTNYNEEDYDDYGYGNEEEYYEEPVEEIHDRFEEDYQEIQNEIEENSNYEALDDKIYDYEDDMEMIDDELEMTEQYDEMMDEKLDEEENDKNVEKEVPLYGLNYKNDDDSYEEIDGYKRKIMLIVHKLASGGSEKAVVKLADNLSRKYKVIIVIFDGRHIDYEPNVEYIDLQMPEEIDQVENAKVMMNRVKAIKTIKKERGITHSISFLPGPNMVNVLSKYADKTIISIRNIVKKSKSEKILSKATRLSIKFAKVVVPVSKTLEKELNKQYKIPVKKMKTIYNICDVDKIIEKINDTSKMYEDEIERLNSENSIVAVGKLIEEGGQWHLIRAFKKVVEEIPDAQLLLIGRGTLEQYLTKIIKDLDLTSNVILTGFKKNPYSYMARAKLFVAPSVYNGMSNTITEALACQVPVMAMDTDSGNREILAPETNVSKRTTEMDQEEYGILLPPCDGKFYDPTDPLTREEEILANSIIDVLKDKRLLNGYKSKIRDRANDFNRDRNLEEWETVLQ